MFRARFASVVAAACLALSGCHSCGDHPWFNCGVRDRCAPAPQPCDPCQTAGSIPIFDGPTLSPPSGPPHGVQVVPTAPCGPQTAPAQIYGTQAPPAAYQPRTVVGPQSMPMAYTP